MYIAGSSLFQHSEKTSFTNAYGSTAGEPVSSVVTKVQGRNGQAIGVIGIDVNLKALTDKTSSLKLGKTGYIVLLENGVVLSQAIARPITRIVEGLKMSADQTNSASDQVSSSSQS